MPEGINPSRCRFRSVRRRGVALTGATLLLALTGATGHIAPAGAMEHVAPAGAPRHVAPAVLTAGVVASGAEADPSTEASTSAAAPATGQFPEDPDSVQAVRDFLGTGFGTPHPDAPPQTSDFGRLVGIWQASQEYRRQDGSWSEGPPAYWVWKYALGGFALQDLWFQSVDALPPYLDALGRDYLLTSTRIYDVRAGGWRIAWSANGGGVTPGADFGTFEAEGVDGRVVMRAPSSDGAPPQRISFEDITDTSFRWTSEFSRDGGETWDAVMRVTARRVR